MCMISAFKVFHNCRADIALSEADHIGYKDTSKILDDLDSLPHRHFLEVSQFLRYFIVPEDIRILVSFKAVSRECVKRFHIDVVRPDSGGCPGLFHFVHESFIDPPSHPPFVWPLSF